MEKDKIQNEIIERIGNASTFYNLAKSLLWNKDIYRKCKITIYVYFKNILLYEVEAWTCTKREESKLQAGEMKLLREIAGKTRRDKIRNTLH
jgi:hypothetical protein